PRLEMRPRMVRSPVDICLGTSPIQAEKSRPLANAAPLTDRCNHRTRDARADARHGHDPSTTAITLCQSLDLVGHGFNSFIELPPVTGKINNDAYHAW